jgi:hypothetical protein
MHLRKFNLVLLIYHAILQKLLDHFPGQLITVELPKLPRPEIGKVSPSEVFGKQVVFHPVTESPKDSMPISEIIKRIQRHILEQRIRIHDFFKVDSIYLQSSCCKIIIVSLI